IIHFMINRFKKRIKNFADSRIKLVKDQQRANQQVNFDFSQITQLFKEDTFIPLSAWAISPSTILHFLNDIIINKRKNIIEFGLGASTFYIAKLLKVLKLEAVFFSVESDEKWVKELRRQLQVYQLDHYVNIIHAPLVKVS